MPMHSGSTNGKTFCDSYQTACVASHFCSPPSIHSQLVPAYLLKPPVYMTILSLTQSMSLAHPTEKCVLWIVCDSTMYNVKQSIWVEHERNGSGKMSEWEQSSQRESRIWSWVLRSNIATLALLTRCGRKTYRIPVKRIEHDAHNCQQKIVVEATDK